MSGWPISILKLLFDLAPIRLTAPAGKPLIAKKNPVLGYRV